MYNPCRLQEKHKHDRIKKSLSMSLHIVMIKNNASASDIPNYRGCVAMPSGNGAAGVRPGLSV